MTAEGVKCGLELTAGDNLQVISGRPVVTKKPCKKDTFLLSTSVSSSGGPLSPSLRPVLGAQNPCTSQKADARTRTGDPFITSDEPMSAPVRSSRFRPLAKGACVDWSGLEVTGEDNLVDGW
jgi:hypothetical protein